MPFLIAKVNVPVDAKQETKLKSQLGKAIELLPGLSEKYLLVDLETDCHMYLRGKKSEPVAYIEVSIFGNDKHIGYENFCRSARYPANERLYKIFRHCRLECQWNFFRQELKDDAR